MVISFTIVKGKCTPKTQTGLHQARTRFEQFLFFCNNNSHETSGTSDQGMMQRIHDDRLLLNSRGV